MLVCLYLAMRLPGASDSGGLGYNVTVSGGLLAFLCGSPAGTSWGAQERVLVGTRERAFLPPHHTGPTVGCRPQDGR